MVDETELRQILAKVAAQGWAAVDQELEAGVRSIAVPIRDSSGRVVAAINASAHAARVQMRTLEKQFLPRLLSAAQQIDAELATRMAVGARVAPLAVGLGVGADIAGQRGVGDRGRPGLPGRG